MAGRSPGQKERIGISPRSDIVKWVDERVKQLRFANRTHAFEAGIMALMDQEQRPRKS